jgi:HPt (histidine-containing phosphotransfer) domain-containing protein
MEAPSLEYFDSIFDGRGPEFWELVAALEVELASYGDELHQAVAARDQEALARLRHSHRPLVRNLGLEELAALEQHLRLALEAGAAKERLAELTGEFQARVSSLAGALGNLRSQGQKT